MRIYWLAAMGMVLVSHPCWAQIPAFSGADGPGATATGGRGGDVYHVTNLEFDLNGTIPGSLKYGLNTAPAGGRTIVFDVGGTIYHDGGGPGWWYRVGTSNITIAGQTAPGGITIAGVGSKWTGSNLILRNITNSSFNSTGGILHADEVDFNLVNNGGTVAPGQSPGMTQIKGDLTINAGTLEIELCGTTPGVDFDLIEVTGDATLAGVLDVSLLSGFVLSPDTTFKFLDIRSTRTGQFTGLGEGALVGNFEENLYITYTAGDGNDVALTTTPTITGDFDFDGDVDGADFLIWQRGGSPDPLSSSDLAIWQTNFGDSVANAIGAAIPEPSSLALAMLLLMTTAAIRAWLVGFTNFL